MLRTTQTSDINMESLKLGHLNRNITTNSTLQLSHQLQPQPPRLRLLHRDSCNTMLLADAMPCISAQSNPKTSERPHEANVRSRGLAVVHGRFSWMLCPTRSHRNQGKPFKTSLINRDDKNEYFMHPFPDTNGQRRRFTTYKGLQRGKEGTCEFSMC